MISIQLDVEGMRLEIDGHANAAPKGEDMICAAVSTLAYTLAYNLELMLNKSEYTAEMDDGHALIEARPHPIQNPIQAEKCMDLFMTIGNGLCMLAGEYDQHIQIKGN